MEWHERDGVRWLEAELPGARAVFPTRSAGSLKAGLGALAGALGVAPDRVVSSRQVHGDRLAFHDDGEAAPAEADGHVLRRPGRAALVYTADCLPVALAGPGGAAILHCGWRGLAAGILARGVTAVEATAAAIGPGIGPCCYEVGPEVLDALKTPPTGLKQTYVVGNRPVDGEGGRVDLAGVARRQLRAAGVEKVESAGGCTRCEAELFFSHRRDAGAGRQGGLVWLEAEGG